MVWKTIFMWRASFASLLGQRRGINNQNPEAGNPKATRIFIYSTLYPVKTESNRCIDNYGFN